MTRRFEMGPDGWACSNCATVIPADESLFADASAHECIPSEAGERR